MDKEKARRGRASEPFPEALHLSQTHHSTLPRPVEGQDPKGTAIHRKHLEIMHCMLPNKNCKSKMKERGSSLAKFVNIIIWVCVESIDDHDWNILLNVIKERGIERGMKTWFMTSGLASRGSHLFAEGRSSKVAILVSFYCSSKLTLRWWQWNKVTIYSWIAWALLDLYKAYSLSM